MSDRLKVRFGRLSVDLNNIVEIYQEFDHQGHHRIYYKETPSGMPTYSEWVGYGFIAHLDIPNVGMFCGTSDYYLPSLPCIFQRINYIDYLPDADVPHGWGMAETSIEEELD